MIPEPLQELPVFGALGLLVVEAGLGRAQVRAL